jgi:hypothetical protein
MEAMKNELECVKAQAQAEKQALEQERATLQVWNGMGSCSEQLNLPCFDVGQAVNDCPIAVQLSNWCEHTTVPNCSK